MIDPIQASELTLLLICSALFSGLNLGIMSLDVNGLEVLMRVGEDSTKRFAAAICPIRKTGNWILCTLLLGNTLVNAIISILLADLTSGLIGSMLATGLIVIFGEIMPQSICSRHGLAVGYYTRYFTYVAMAVLSPVAYPIAKFLDFVVRGEISHFFSRKELKEFISLHAAEKGKGGELDVQEVEIMSGALDMGEMTVDQVCTPIEKVNILNSSAVLDRKTVQNLARDGHSRIPVADNEGGIIGVLLVKSLLLLDQTSEYTIEQILKDSNQPYLVTPIFVNRKEKLDDILSRFLKDKKQLAFVIDHEEGEIADPSFVNYSQPTHSKIHDIPLERSKSSYFTKGTRGGTRALIGVITMEDVMEAIIKHSIDDEVDALRAEKPSIYGLRVQSKVVSTNGQTVSTATVTKTTVATTTSSTTDPTSSSGDASKAQFPASPTWRRFHTLFKRASVSRIRNPNQYGTLEESKSYVEWQSTATTPFLRPRTSSEPALANDSQEP